MYNKLQVASGVAVLPQSMFSACKALDLVSTALLPPPPSLSLSLSQYNPLCPSDVHA